MIIAPPSLAGFVKSTCISNGARLGSGIETAGAFGCDGTSGVVAYNTLESLEVPCDEIATAL